MARIRFYYSNGEIYEFDACARHLYYVCSRFARANGVGIVKVVRV
jgi:hypothetical protein